MRGNVFTRWFAACVLAVMGGTSAGAEDYPSKTIKLVVPYAAGGSTDIFARLIGQKLEQTIGASVVIENRGGASGNIGSDLVARSEPDGYTLLVGTGGTHASNHHVYAKMPFHPLRDFKPVGFIASVPNVMVVNPKKLNVVSVEEFLIAARKTKLAFASSGNGSSIHLSGELFKQLTGIEMTHVPYRGAGPALNGLIAGDVDVLFDNLPSSLQHVRMGTLRALTVTSQHRAPSLPNVPSAVEVGLPELQIESWFAIFAPANTPTVVLDKLNAAINKSMNSPDVKAKIADLGGDIRMLDRDQLAAFVNAEYERWGKVVKAAGVRIIE